MRSLLATAKLVHHHAPRHLVGSELVVFACCHARSGCSACSSSRVRFITLREREGCRAFSYSVCGSGKAAFYIVPECQPRHVADTRSFSALLSNDSLLYTFLYSFFALHHKLSHSPKPQASPTVGCMSCKCTTTSTHFSSPAQRQGPLAQCTITISEPKKRPELAHFS